MKGWLGLLAASFAPSSVRDHGSREFDGEYRSRMFSSDLPTYTWAHMPAHTCAYTVLTPEREEK